MNYKDIKKEVVYIGKSDGCRVETQDGVVDVLKGQSIVLQGIQLSYALTHGFIEKEIYDEEYKDKY